MKWIFFSLFFLNILFLGLNWQALDKLPDQAQLTQRLMQQGDALILLNNDNNPTPYNQQNNKQNSNKHHIGSDNGKKLCYKLYSRILNQQAVQLLIKLLVQQNIQAYQNRETELHQWLYLKFPRESWAKNALDAVKPYANAYLINETAQEWLVSLGTYKYKADVQQLNQQVEQLGYQVYSQPKPSTNYTISINELQSAERFSYLLQNQGLAEQLRAIEPALNMVKTSCSTHA